MKISFSILPLLILICISSGKSQSIDPEDALRVPGISAIGLYSNQVEITTFANYSYDQQVFNFGSPPYRQIAGEANTISANLQFTYGLSARANFNIGFDVNYSNSTFNNNENFTETSSQFVALGPRVRWRPFGGISDNFDVTLQHYMHFPVHDPEELFSKQSSFGNQVLITKYFLDVNIILSLQSSFIINFESDIDYKRAYLFPTSVFAGYQPRTNIMIYGSANYIPELGTLPWTYEEERYLRREGITLGLGFQYILFNTYAINLAHDFKVSDTRGIGANVFTLGWRMILG